MYRHVIKLYISNVERANERSWAVYFFASWLNRLLARHVIYKKDVESVRGCSDQLHASGKTLLRYIRKIPKLSELLISARSLSFSSCLSCKKRDKLSSFSMRLGKRFQNKYQITGQSISECRKRRRRKRVVCNCFRERQTSFSKKKKKRTIA